MTTVAENALAAQREAEKMFVAAAFTAPEIALERCGWLAPEAFLDERIGKFWGLLKSGKQPVEASFESGGAAMHIDILKWMVDIPSTLLLEEYANQIAKSTYLAGVGAALSDLARLLAQGDAGAVQQALRELSSHTPVGAQVFPSAEIVSERFIAIVQSEIGSVIQTGVPAIDKNSGGLPLRSTSAWASPPSVGKTALTFQVARNVSGPMKTPVVYFSMEMADTELWARAACGEMEISWNDVLARKIDKKQEHCIVEKSRELAELYGSNLTIIDKTQTTESIWQTCAQLRPMLVITDHIRLIKDTHPSRNESKRQGMITERLHDMAKSLNLHVMEPAQLNRDWASRSQDRKRPELTDLRDSGEIEENEDQVFMLYREDVANPNPEAAPSRYHEVEVWVRKNRNGKRDGMIRLAFDELRQWFDPWNTQGQEANAQRVSGNSRKVCRRE
jgi:replicative DNA helicase